MKIGVVVTAYNLAEWLPDCLDSIEAQTRVPELIVVVDDGSTDGTQDYLEQRGIDHIRITNRGVAQAKNAGAMWMMNRTYLDALVFADADDKMFPPFLKRTEELMAKDDGLGLVSTGLVADGITVQGGYWPAADRPNINDERDRNVIWQMGLVRARAFVECGGFSHRAGPIFDWDLWIDFMKRGWRFRGIDEPLWYWRDRPDAMHQEIDDSHVTALHSRHPEVFG